MIQIEKTSQSFCNFTFFNEPRQKEVYAAFYQAFSYYVPNHRFMPAVKQKKWDGKISLFNPKTGTLALGCIYRALKILDSLGVSYTFKNKDYFRDKAFEDMTGECVESFAQMSLRLPERYKLRDYQISAILDILRWNRGLILSPTSSGKSLIMYFIAAIMFISERNRIWKNTLIIVPRVSLVEQLYGDFCEYAAEAGDASMIPFIHKLYGGKDKDVFRPIMISTWQSLQDMPREFFQNFGCVIVDEVHESTAKVLKTIVQQCSRAPYKVGLTGSIQDTAAHKIELEGLFGKTFQYTTTRELMDSGTVSNLAIHNLILQYGDEDRKKVSTMTYHEEAAYVRTHEGRFNTITKIACRLQKNTLILFRDVADGYGKRIAQNIKDNTSKKVLYIDGHTKVEDRENARKWAEAKNDIVIVASLGVFSTGINIRNLHYLILAEAVKSKIKILQSIGRVLRLNENKEKAVFIDIVDDLCLKSRKNFLYRHFEERVKQYDEQGFEYETKEVFV